MHIHSKTQHLGLSPHYKYKLLSFSKIHNILLYFAFNFSSIAIFYIF